MNPYIAVVTNIEGEHLDYYGDIENIKNAFIKFLMKIPDEGFLVLGSDNPNISDIMQRINKRIFTFGIKNKADFMAENIKLNGTKTIFDFVRNGRF